MRACPGISKECKRLELTVNMTPEGLLRERHADTHAHRKTETQPHADT